MDLLIAVGIAVPVGLLGFFAWRYRKRIPVLLRMRDSEERLSTLKRASHIALVWLGVQALFYSTVWVSVDASGSLLFHALLRRLPQPYTGILFLLCTFAWITFSLVSLTVLVWALVRFRRKPLIVASLISIALGAYIFLCYVGLFASSHD